MASGTDRRVETSAPFRLTDGDLEQIRSSGRSPTGILDEVEAVRLGTPAVKLIRPCTVRDGVVRLTAAKEIGFAKCFQRWAPSKLIVKFVPASGSASRMFQALRAYLDRAPPESTTDLTSAEPESEDEKQVRVFLERLPELALYSKLRECVTREEIDSGTLVSNGQWRRVLACLLDTNGLNYGRLPKGLIPYHHYPDGPRTAFEEHLLEAAGYARGSDGVIRVHFTVAPEHSAVVRDHLREAARRFARPATRYSATVSIQDPRTDTLALDGENRPVRDGEGRLVFRPSGHGAVLENLDSVHADIVFIKTVDNVLPDRLKPIICFYKRVLGGYLLILERRIHAYLKVLSSKTYSVRTIRGISSFARRSLSVRQAPDFEDLGLAEKARVLYDLLNRPLRVCGVVPRIGQPGGAPFWVESHEGVETLRIVEPAEVNRDFEDQCRIWESARYFNPVDIVCSVRDFRGRRFRLSDYQDPMARFVVSKSHGNRTVKILERPGLWNGAMARWNTVFVEIPQITVHPVKSVMDLLDAQHRT